MISSKIRFVILSQKHVSPGMLEIFYIFLYGRDNFADTNRSRIKGITPIYIYIYMSIFSHSRTFLACPGERHVRRKRPRTFHEVFPTAKAEKVRGKADITMIAVVQRACSANAIGGSGERETREKIRSVIKRRTI